MQIVIGEPIVVNVHIFSSRLNVYATGAIILKDNNKTIATKYLNSLGSITFSLKSDELGIGIHELIVYYAGDKNFAASISDVMIRNIVDKK